MAKARAYLGMAVGGEFIPKDRIAYMREFLKPKPTEMVVTVKQFFPKRSTDANAYYHGVVVRMIGEEIEGQYYDHDETHELLKHDHNAIISVSKGGKEVRKARSTIMPSDEFWAYVARCKAWALDFLGVYIPDPNEEIAKLMIEEYMQKAEAA